MYRNNGYLMSPEGVAGAAGTNGEQGTGATGGNTGGEQSGTNPQGTTDNKIKVPYRGRVVELDPVEAHALLSRGIDAMVEERNKGDAPPDKSGNGEAPDPVAELTKQVDELKSTLYKDRVASEAREIKRNINSLAAEHDLTKNDPEMASLIEAVTVTELNKNPHANLEEVYKRKVKMLGDKINKEKSTYTKEKADDAKKTAAPSSSGGSSPGTKAPDKPNPNSLIRGETRRRAMERLNRDAAANSGGRLT